MKGITITPDPGFVVKTKQISDGKKVFINVCTHAELHAPSQKKRLNDEGEEVEGMNIRKYIYLSMKIIIYKFRFFFPVREACCIHVL
jgi:hypothetical protein